MNNAKHLRQVGAILALGLALAWACPGIASPKGDTAAEKVTVESYRHFLDDLLYTHYGDNRGYGAEHDLARDNIVAQMQSYGLTVTLEPFVCECDCACDGETYYNVVGTMHGITYPQQEYIIGAHFDSKNNPGADDNASGVALVLEAARVLTEYESEYTIRFIAFDREEQGLLGAWAYAEDHLDDDILAMISADMVAYNKGTNAVDIYAGVASAPLKSDLGAAVATYGDGLGYALLGPSSYSDNAPFAWYGFQACLLIEDWGNPNYHTQYDTVDMGNYIDYDYATQITRVVVGFLVDQAGVDVPLDCNDNDVDDRIDVATGYSLDCNENDVPDECEPDCDESGIPDACEVGRPFSASSPELSPLYSGAIPRHTFNSLPPAGNDVTLSFTASADLSSDSEYVIVLLNSMLVPEGDIFDVDAADCSDPPDSDEILLTAEWFNGAVGDGVATISMYPSPGVNAGACAQNSYITVTVTYETTGLPDCNDNLVPDFCDAAGDADGDGRLGLPDHARTAECMSGPCSDPPCDPPLYADSCCVIADFDLDGDYDLLDFSAFQLGIGGNVP
ncbi:MAG: M28 family metallopeptidase [Planctomycetota bacterium]